MNKIDISGKENLWLYGLLISVLALGNISGEYPVVGIIQPVLLFALMGYSVFRLIQTLRDARGENHKESKNVDAALGSPQIIQAFETVLYQAGHKNVHAPDDGPKLVEAMREVAKQAK